MLPADEVTKRVKRLHAIIEACSPKTGADWKKFELELCTIWRRWDSTGALTVIISWIAAGSLQQQIAGVRDPDVAEPLWDGASWEMSVKHADGASLCRWLQKDPFTGRKTEFVLERVVCDCLDHERPCWVLLERAPDVPDFPNFSGKYKSFDIEACPKGYIRAETADSGRIFEPVTPESCRISMSMTVQIPAVIRWALTDSLLCWAANAGSRSSTKSWNNIIDKWGSVGYDQRTLDEASFYGPVNDRIKEFTNSRTTRM